LVRRLLAEPPAKKPAQSVSPEVQALEEEFRETLGTKVNLYRNQKGRGRLVIHFYSEEELQAIYDVITGGA
jgi:ParB family chromosome partitioning protein